jgi:hypothetical protein
VGAHAGARPGPPLPSHGWTPRRARRANLRAARHCGRRHPSPAVGSHKALHAAAAGVRPYTARVVSGRRGFNRYGGLVLEPTPEVSSLVTILGVWIEEIPKLKQIKQHLQGKSDKITFLISGDGSDHYCSHFGY